jgi:hypothetical protein
MHELDAAQSGHLGQQGQQSEYKMTGKVVFLQAETQGGKGGVKRGQEENDDEGRERDAEAKYSNAAPASIT